MDFCLNRDDDGATFAEVKDALHIVENSRDSSQMGERFHAKIMHVMRKHNVNMTTTESGFQDSGLPLSGGSVDASDMSIRFDLPLDASSDGLELDALWQDFLKTAPALNAQDWNALLSDIDLNTM